MDSPVSDVINMFDQIVTILILCDEGPQFGILDGNLFRPRVSGQNLFQLCVSDIPAEMLNLFLFDTVTHFVQFVKHPMESHGGGIGYVRKHGILHVMPDGIQDSRHQCFAEALPLPVDLNISPPGEIDPFEGAGLSFLGLFTK